MIARRRLPLAVRTVVGGTLAGAALAGPGASDGGHGVDHAPLGVARQGTGVALVDGRVVVVGGLPAQQSGLFVYSLDPTQVPLGDGHPSVAPGALGFVPRLPFEASDATGVMRHALDLASPAAPAAKITPASTWCFTCWHGDVPAGGAGFDFADGLQILFAP